MFVLLGIVTVMTRIKMGFLLTPQCHNCWISQSIRSERVCIRNTLSQFRVIATDIFDFTKYDYLQLFMCCFLFVDTLLGVCPSLCVCRFSHFKVNNKLWSVLNMIKIGFYFNFIQNTFHARDHIFGCVYLKCRHLRCAFELCVFFFLSFMFSTELVRLFLAWTWINMAFIQ